MSGSHAGGGFRAFQQKPDAVQPHAVSDARSTGESKGPAVLCLHLTFLKFSIAYRE